MASSAIPNIKLNTGAEIPAIGLGTWQSDKGQVRAAVKYALTETPIRHIDAAYIYQNEEEVGQGIKDAIDSGKVTRAEIFVTTKVFQTYHNRVEESLEKSLKLLGLDYVDLLLYHWPLGFNPKGNDEFFPKKEDGTIDTDPSFDITKTWKAFEKIQKSGKAKAVGVSNVSVSVFEKFLPTVEIVPAVNQIENHPLLPGDEIVKYCKEKNIIIEAYSPLGSTGAPLLDNEIVTAIAKKHDVPPATILISWHVNEGRVVLPKSITPSRIATNAKWVKLDDDDLKKLDTLSEKFGLKRVVKPDWGNVLGFPDWN